MPGPYIIVVPPRVEKAIGALHPEDQRRVRLRIRALAETPRPPGAVKLAGDEDLYRVRAGHYRVIYTIQDRRLIVLIVRVAHRGDAY